MMLPGVEAARRRGFHKTNNVYAADESAAPTSSRRSFCLYAASSHSSLLIRKPSIIRGNKITCDESKLDVAAREAKKRLDERLQPTSRSQKKRSDTGG